MVASRWSPRRVTYLPYSHPIESATMKRMSWIGCSLLMLGIASGTLRAEEEAGFVPLYNGKDLTGWQGNLTGYVP